ncbi:MAG: hypothetical protein OEW27_14360 [Aquincola sp.]|nr:hypothetical protein [Aquincola sp.]
MQKADVFTRLKPPQPGDLPNAGRRFLAEGDSWFTLGTLNLAQGTNLLIELKFKQHNAIVSWAYPGDTLRRMVDGINDFDFDRALWNRSGGNFASFWEGIIVSAGGNDLIEAAEAPPVKNGQTVPVDRRLFLTATEAAALPGPPGPLRRISEQGWSMLTEHLYANFKVLLERKDNGPSARSPLFLHTYAMPAARPSGVGPTSRGWLFAAMEAYGIAPADMQPICTELFTRLREFLLSLDNDSGKPRSLSKVHVFDSAGLADIVPATPGAPGVSGDWVNEIHLTAGGYRKMGPPFGRFIDDVVDRYFGAL